MSPYEITANGGSVEHFNDESGATWLNRFVEKYKNIVWLNPSNEYFWDDIPSVQIIKQIFKDRMYALTLDGISNAMKTLKKNKRAV